MSPTLSAQQLVDAVPGLAATEIAIEVVDFRRRPGASLTFADVTELADAAADTLADGVVTQGTERRPPTCSACSITGTNPSSSP